MSAFSGLMASVAARHPRQDIAHERMALDLAGRGERELREQLQPLGQLVGGHAVADEGDQAVERRRLARARHQAETIALAQPRIGNPDDRGVEDLRMGVEDLLDLAREELLAAAVDHLLEAADDAQAAIRVDHPEIAAAEPAV